MVTEKLPSHGLFDLLTPKEVDRISDASAVMKLKKGERVYSDGVPASHLFILLKGRVQLRRPTRGGLSFVVEDVSEGSFFGVSSLMGRERYVLNAECVEDCEVLKVEVGVFRRILDENPVVGYATQAKISQIFFKRYLDAMERLQAVMQAIPADRL